VPINRQDRVDHWRSLAADVLAAAADATDPAVRATLVTIAALYDGLAIKAEITAPMGSIPQPILPSAMKSER
jgi:hypothetical protein